MSLPMAFADILPEHYPVTMEFLAGDRVVHTVTMPEPGIATIPPLVGKYGPIGVRLTFGDGTVIEQPAPGS